MKHVWLTALGLMMTAVLPGPGLPSAAADPVIQQDPAPPTLPADALVINWRSMGLSDKLEINAAMAPAVEIPTPQALAPVMITGDVRSSGAAGVIDVLDRDGTTVGSIAVPADSATAPFTVNIAAAKLSSGPLKLSFRQRKAEPAADGCAGRVTVTLSKLATTFNGPAPVLQTVADFLPDYLDQITVEIGAEPSVDQQQAALTLVAELTHHYRPMPVRVDVDTSALPPPPGDSRTRRTIAIRNGGSPGVAVENPGTAAAVLVITGTGAELPRQVQLFTDRRFELAQTQTVAVTSLARTVPTSTDTLTFGELGITGQTTVMGTDTAYVGVDTTRFGLGQLDGARFHIIAEYTPVINDDGSVIVRSGSDILATGVLDHTGVTVLDGEIPAASIGSSIGMALEIRYAPAGGQCSFGALSFSIDPTSTITAIPGANNRGGFTAIPVAFTPDFDVTVEHPDQIHAAAQVINLMGQQSTVTLQPSIASLAEAAKRGTGLLAIASGEQLRQLGMRPPVVLSGTGAVEVNGSTDTDLDLTGALGVVQSFSDHGRVVLAVDATGDPNAADRSLDYIRGQDGTWSALTGDVVATGAAGQVINLSVAAGTALAAPVSDGWRWWIWCSIAATAVGVPAVTAVGLLRRRRGKHRDAPVAP